MGKSLLLSLNTSAVFPLFLPNFKDIDESKILKVELQIDKCKPGEVFDGEFCIPCPLNTFSSSENLEGSTYQCPICNEQDKFFCYGADKRSPKRNYWRSSSVSNRFLRCPSTKCLGDPFFFKNISFAYCEQCLIPGTDARVFSFAENFTAIGACEYGYLGVLCLECREGFGATGNFNCFNCSEKLIYLKQSILFVIKLLLFFYMNRVPVENLGRTRSKHFDRKKHHSAISSSTMLSLLIFYFTILSIFKALPFEQEYLIVNLFSDGISIIPSENFDIFSFKCMLDVFNISIAPIYMRVINNFIFLFLSFFFIVLYNIWSNRTNGYLRVKAIFYSFVTSNLILIFNTFVPLFICVDIGNWKTIGFANY